MRYTDSPKKHHYVNKSYLKRWLTRSSAEKFGLHVFNKQRNKHFFCTDLDSISQVRYFNRLDVDRDVYDLLLYKYQKVDGYPAKFLEALEELTLIDQYKKDKHPNYAALDTINKSFLEQEFSDIETQISLALNAAEKISEYTSLKGFQSELSHRALALTFCTQFFRTKSIRERVIKDMQEIGLHRRTGATKLATNQIENLIKAILFIESNRMMESMVKNGFSASILVNQSDKNFITSNTPANVRILSTSPAKSLCEVEGFMALTPRVAFSWSGKGSEIEVRQFDLNSVENENRKSFQVAAEEIYSTHKLLP